MRYIRGWDAWKGLAKILISKRLGVVLVVAMKQQVPAGRVSIHGEQSKQCNSSEYAGNPLLRFLSNGDLRFDLAQTCHKPAKCYCGR